MQWQPGSGNGNGIGKGNVGNGWLDSMDAREHTAATSIQSAWRARRARQVARAMAVVRRDSDAARRLRDELGRAERMMEARLQAAADAAYREAEAARRSELEAAAATARSSGHSRKPCGWFLLSTDMRRCGVRGSWVV